MILLRHHAVVLELTTLLLLISRIEGKLQAELALDEERIELGGGREAIVTYGEAGI